MTSDPVTLATTTHMLATLLTASVGVYALRSRGFLRPTLHLTLLLLGAASGVTVVVSGIYLMDQWAIVMEHFDFTERMRGHVNPRRFPDEFYFLPATSTTFGLVATLAFLSLLYRRVRGLG